MYRRQVLAAIAAAALAPLAAGHSPYGQWRIYRQRHLLVFAAATDPAADELSDRLAALLLEHLPASRADSARAPNEARIASLITSGQADTALLGRASALALYLGDPPFKEYGPAPLRVLVENERHQLVCRDDFPRRHGYLVAQVLAEQGAADGLHVPDRPAPKDDSLPTHEGALAYLRGEAPGDK